ncbi:MAG TPA: Crp/Fnr family transcriptional regulator [Chitinophagales bacterium]|nr:Crp/Fnr family transcriptional regulator [Chitinophagales bacterium]
MKAESFINKLQEFQELPAEVVEDIISKVQKAQLHKRTMVLKAGQVCENIYFVEKGLARTFYTSEGKDYTTDICIDGEFMVEFSSFVHQQPSMQNMELIEDCTLYYVSYDDLQELYRTYPIMERIGRLIAEYHYLSLSTHSYLLKFNTTAERYDYLFQNKIEIIRRAPLGVIASFLGMSIENLSRIRKKGDS